MSTNHHDRRVEHYRTSANRSFSRGFAVGFIACAIIVALFLYGQRNAYGSTRPAPRYSIAAKHKPESIVAMAHRLHWPRGWRTWLRIGVCEQPKPGTDLYYIRTDMDRYRAIYWDNPGSRFPGGLGFTPLNWTQFRPPSARHLATMNLATPTQQLWAAEKIFRHYAAIGGQRYGATVWECHDRIAMGEKFGFHGFNADGSWR